MEIAEVEEASEIVGGEEASEVAPAGGEGAAEVVGVAEASAGG